MDICFVPSLEHLACAKIVTLLLNDSDIDLLHGSQEEVHDRNTLKVKDSISKLIPCNRLRAKLENFITPILCEATNWVKYCRNPRYVGILRLPVNDVVQKCWLSDGSIDQEKSLKILVHHSDISILDRFVFACRNCMSEDVLNLWEMLHDEEKRYFRQRHFIPQYPVSIVRNWINWLDNSTNKDWESCAVWILETSLWKNNAYILKRVLKTLNPVEKSYYLLKALLEKDVRSDVMRFGLQIMSRDEWELILREYPLEVFKCFLSWPLRGVFTDLVDSLWPYITANIFCSILATILSMIKERDYIDLLEILKSFWAQSPSRCKKAAKKVKAISRPLNYVLKNDFPNQFIRHDFLNSFNPQSNRSAVYRRAMMNRTRRRARNSPPSFAELF